MTNLAMSKCPRNHCNNVLVLITYNCPFGYFKATKCGVFCCHVVDRERSCCCHSHNFSNCCLCKELYIIMIWVTAISFEIVRVQDWKHPESLSRYTQFNFSGPWAYLWTWSCGDCDITYFTSLKLMTTSLVGWGAHVILSCDQFYMNICSQTDGHLFYNIMLLKKSNNAFQLEFAHPLS